jgi:DNA-binding XRE family transcriptional regulator
MAATKAPTRLATRRRRWAAGTYMELRDPKMLALFMQQKRERTGLNASDLARAAGVSRQFISQLKHEHDKTCKPETADLIARFLDVPLEALFVEKSSRVTGQSVRQQKRAA